MPLNKEDKDFISTLPTKEESNEVFIAGLPQKEIPVSIGRIPHGEDYLPQETQRRYYELLKIIDPMQEDYIPYMLPGIGVGLTMQTMARGGSLLYGLTRGGIATGLAAGAEGYIRPLEEYAGAIHPYLHNKRTLQK